MKKQQVQVMILFVVLLLCIGGYIVAKQIPDEETEALSESYTVSNVDKNNVIGISYFYEGKIIDLVKEDDKWMLKDDSSLELEQSQIETMLDNVCNITTDTMIEDVETLETYGLSNPSNTICLTLDDGSIVQLLIGDYMEFTGDYYALIPGDTKVYTIASYIVTSFEKTVEELLVVEENTTVEETKAEEATVEETAFEETTESDKGGSMTEE